MNGAEVLIQTLCDSGVEVCFANPGTSEMQLVAAIDGQPKMRAILGLFEGVVTGAADGYGRMADKPAITLLHLGPGLGNGLANLHNAKRARSPIVNIVGDHAVHHLQYDAPLTSDVRGVALPMSDWVEASTSPDNLVVKGVKAVEASLTYPGKVATLIAPADHAWTETKKDKYAAAVRPTPKLATKAAVEKSARALLKKSNTALYLGGMALRKDALVQAGRIAAKTGARLICETFPARLQRGAGRVAVERLPYFGELAADYIKDFDEIVFVGAPPPVAFFAYPGKESLLTNSKTKQIILADPRRDALDALTRLADALDAPKKPALVQKSMIMPTEPGKLTPVGVASVVAELLPKNAIVSDESTTAGLAIFPHHLRGGAS